LHVNVKVDDAVGGIIFVEPFGSCEPDHALLAMQAVAFVLDQLNCVAACALTEGGLAEIVTVGSGAGEPEPPPHPTGAAESSMITSTGLNISRLRAADADGTQLFVLINTE
jgi:hypothetical protein